MKPPVQPIPYVPGRLPGTGAPCAIHTPLPRPRLGSEPLPNLAAGLISASDLNAMCLDERPLLLGPWMKRGDFGYLFAPRGAGKTWMALLIADAVSKGWRLGKWDEGEGPQEVVYFDAEMNLVDVRERSRGIGIDSRCFRWLSNEALYLTEGFGVNIAAPTHQQALSALLPDGCFFIIDNLSTAQIGMAENDNDSFDAIRDWILTLRHRGITVMIVHHAGRNGAMRGSSRREDMAHWIISLKETPEERPGVMAFITNFEKCRNCPYSSTPPLRWTLTIGPQGIITTCDVHHGLDTMLAHIRDGVSSAHELAELLGVHKATISKWAKKLVEAHKITKSGGFHGGWVVVE